VRPRLIPAWNLAKAWSLLLALCAAFGLLGYAIGGYRLISPFVLSALLMGATVYWYADRIVLAMLDAREIQVGQAPVLHDTFERLARRAGVLRPKLYLLDDGFPRALASGRGPAGGAGVAVSRGLVDAVTPAELEGVLAHELAHVANRDVVVQTFAVLVALALIELSRVGGFLQRALLFVCGPVAAAFVHLLLSPKRELAADRLAAEICESPHGLADALLRLEQATELIEFSGSPATEPLYTVNPFAETGLAALFSTHPPIGERVARLRALDPGWRDRLRAA
jgi:heat shock protein HtpX